MNSIDKKSNPLGLILRHIELLTQEKNVQGKLVGECQE